MGQGGKKRSKSQIKYGGTLSKKSPSVIDKRSNRQGEIPDIPPYFDRPFVAVRFNESPSSCPKGKSTIAFKCLLKRPTSQSGSTELAEVLRRGWLFGVTYQNTRGAIA